MLMRLFAVILSLFVLETYAFSENLKVVRKGRFVIIKMFPSKYLKFKRNIILFLPESYDSSDKRYPVIYAHDGQNLFDPKTSFAGEWHLDENIDRLVKKKLMKEVIVAGIYNTAMRIDEYTPTLMRSKELPGGKGGGLLSNYAKFIVDELKPYIDSHYRTLPDRENTAVMGSSLGGIASFYILGWYPDVFGKAIVMSPSFWWDNVRVTNDIKSLRFRKDSCVYIDGGWLEGGEPERGKINSMIKNMRLVYRALLKKGFQPGKNLFYYEDAKGQHNERFWASRLKIPLTLLFGTKKILHVGEKLKMFPSRIGVGDTAFFWTEQRFKYGIKQSIFIGRFSVDNKKIATIDQSGKLTALKPGEVVVYMSGRNLVGEKFKVSKKVTIASHSADVSIVKLTVVSKVPVEKVYAHITSENGKKVNKKIPFRKNPDGSFSLEIEKKTGSSAVVFVENGKGQKAIRVLKSGRRKILKKYIMFTKDRSYKFEVVEFD